MMFNGTFDNSADRETKFNHLLSVNIKHEIRKIRTKMMKIYAMSMDVNNSVA